MPPGLPLGSARVAGLASPCGTSMPARMPNTRVPHQLTPPSHPQEWLCGMQGWEDPGEGEPGNSWDEHSVA